MVNLDKFKLQNQFQHSRKQSRTHREQNTSASLSYRREQYPLIIILSDTVNNLQMWRIPYCYHRHQDTIWLKTSLSWCLIPRVHSKPSFLH